MAASSRSVGICEEALHHPDTEGDVERRIGDDQPEPGVEQSELKHQEIDRDQDHHRRHDAQGQERQPDGALEVEAQMKSGDGIGGERADDERQRHRAGGHHQRVGEIVAELLLREQPPIVVEGRRMRVEGRLLGDLEIGFERGSDHPIDRQEHDHEDQRRHQAAKEARAHDSPARRNMRTAAKARARMIRPMVRNKAAA